jgi:hypothetical protein
MFARDYYEARDRFRQLAGDRVDVLPLSVRGPRGEDLSIDIAWLGAQAPRRILLVTSGLHGVEGFAGSAVQCALLQDPPVPAADCALVLVHALNPWGFACLRRVNENNVDLNRNFLPAGAQYAGMPTLYPRLEGLLNPSSAPRADAFTLRAAGYALRYGFAACQQAIAGGQYECAHGLFYGGKHIEEGPARFTAWLRSAMASATRLLVLDLHTGLGRFGVQTLFAEPDMPAERVAWWARALAARIEGGAGATDPGGFAARGTLAGAVRECAAHASPEFFTVEYGTYSPLRILHALREENRWHRYGDGGLHDAKRRLVEVFSPAAQRWREGVAVSGTQLVRAAAADLVTR